MATLKQKKKLIDKIVHGNKKYRFNFYGYGGEVAMGTIHHEQYDYWKNREDELSDYLFSSDKSEHEQQNSIPDEAKMPGEWYEHEDICHGSGIEMSEHNTLNIEEMDQDGNLIKNWDPIFLGYQTLEKHGIQQNYEDQIDLDHEKVRNKHYLFAQAVNKGSWSTTEILEISEELDLAKLQFNLLEAEGWALITDITYGDKNLYLEENSDGKSQSAVVMEGYQDTDSEETSSTESTAESEESISVSKKKKTKAKGKIKIKTKAKSKNKTKPKKKKK